MKQTIVCRSIVLALAVLLTSAVAKGQTAEFTQGSPGTNTMSLQVPLGSYPGRGLSLPINLNYSSRVWRLGFIKSIYYTYGGSNPLAEAIYSEYATAGWTTSLDVPLVEWPKQNDAYWYTGKPYTRGTHSPYTFRVARVFIHMPDGSTHELRKADQVYQDNGSIDMAGSFYAVDGSRMRYDGTNATTGTLYLADGTRYSINSSTVQCIDRNGNTLSYDRASRQWTDTMGRTIGMPWPANPQAGTDYSYALPAVGGGTHSYTLKFKSLANSLSPNTPALKPVGDFYLPYPDQAPTDYNSSNFTQATQGASMFVSGYSDPEELNYQTYTRVIGRGQPGNTAFNPVVLAEVVLPNGLSYKFSYNNYGELDKVIYPGGSYQRYQFGQVPGLTQQTIPYPQVNRGMTSRWLSANGAGNDEVQWLYGFDAGGWSVTAPGPTGAPNGIKTVAYLYTGGTTQNNFGYDSALIGMPYDERVYAYDGGPMVRRTLTSWATSDQTYTRPPQGSGTYTATRNPRPTKTVSLILDTGGSALTSAATSQYDTTYQFTYGVDRTQSAEYGFTTVDQTTAQTGAITAIPMGALVRSSETAFVTDSNYLAQNILGLVSSSTVKSAAGTIVSQSSAAYDEGAYPLLTYGSVPGWTAPASGYRGNVTTASRWLDFPSSTWISTHTQYDQCGSVRNIADARGSLSQIEYSSAYAYAYPTQSTSAVPDPSGTYGQTVSLVSTATFDFNTGLSISATDPNGNVTTFEYYDPLNRPTKVNRPDGGWSITNYNDTVGNAYIHSETLRQSTPTQETMDSYQYFDRLGRGVRSFAYEGSTYLTSDTQYDSLGRVWRVSNPYRTSVLNDPVNPSGNWTTNTYDSLNRVVAVTAPDGAQVTTQYPAVTTGSYIGTSVLVGDPSPTQKKRQSISDAQGRMIQVIEDPAGLAYQTNYTYDTLNNLRKVEQGTQLRYFGYDSLSRPIRARNVEQVVNTGLNWTDPVTGYDGGWTSGVSYDNNGNITTRLDARNVTTSYTYDALNRNTLMDYSDATPDAYRKYDQATNGKGRINQTWQSGTNTSMTNIDQYDVVGRPLVQRQRFETSGVWSSSYQTQRSYDLAGHVKTQTYPSNRTVTYNYDRAGRLADKDASNPAFSGDLGGQQKTYSTGVSYSPFGGMSKEQFGTDTPLYNKQFYNVRGQLAEIRVGTYSTDEGWWNRGAILNVYSDLASWTESREDNNGTLRKQMVYIPNDDAITGYVDSAFFYTYDSLNRLDVAREVVGGQNAWVQDYDYDRYGNRTNTSSTGVNSKNFTVNTGNNRLGVPAGQSGELNYDNAGNVVRDTYSGAGYTRAYDAENHMTAETPPSGVVSGSYEYDAAGQRVRRKVNNVESWQIYGMDGELLAEYAAGAAVTNPQKEYGYRNGQLLVTAEPTSFAETSWVEDSVPAGAATAGDSEGWNWISSNPTPAAGSVSHQSNIVGGEHQHYFYGATSTLAVAAGDKLFAYVYLDPANVPTEVMLQFNDGSWEHRAYWGANNLGWGVNGTDSRRSMGPLPSAGGWVRLEVAASQVGLEGHTLNGMAFSLWDGRATWDRAGKAAATATANINWLVADQLGTPRLIYDKTGSLANTKRHDYLPFGEELYAGTTANRTIPRGYTGDSVRQHFTGYEADGETGLNYAQARYQSPVQGRFTSVDPLGASASVGDPQSFNRYSYVKNDPINLTDPTGMMTGADASQSWGDVSGTFWGDAFDFNASHFGGPQIIQNGMNMFPDRQEEEAEEEVSNDQADAPTDGKGDSGLDAQGKLTGTDPQGAEQMQEQVCNNTIAAIFGGPQAVAATVHEPATLLSPVRGIDRSNHLVDAGVFHLYTNAQGTEATTGLYRPSGGHLVSGGEYWNGRTYNKDGTVKDPGKLENFFRFAYNSGQLNGVQISFVHVGGTSGGQQNGQRLGRFSDRNAAGSVRIGNIGGLGGEGPGYNHTHIKVFVSGRLTDPRKVFCK